MSVRDVKPRGKRALLMLAGAAALWTPETHAAHPLTIDDVMNLSTVNEAAPSPDGEWLASVVVRPADESGVYGRTFYELDPARADIWLTSRHTGARRNLTDGATDAAGFWCASWSPDGQRLAMLSTRPERGEPKGGNNVRLYVWDRATGAISRVSDMAIASQTIGGSATYRVDMRGGPGGDATHKCGSQIDAPFAWLDNTHILAAAMPDGATSGLLDVYSRGLRHEATTLERLHDGREPTVSAVGSGRERVAPSDPASSTFTLALFDLANDRSSTVPGIPNFPFRNAPQILISPDRTKVAVLAATGGVQPHAGETMAYNYHAWATENRLGVVDLAAGASIRWLDTAKAGLVLDLVAWSPSGTKLAVRGRSSLSSRDLALFGIAADGSATQRMSSAAISVGGAAAGTDLPSNMSLFWIDEHRIVARAVAAGKDLDPYEWYRASLGLTAAPRQDWWLLADNQAPANLTATLAKPPVDLWRAPGTGQFRGLGADTLWAIDAVKRTVHPIPATGLPANAALAWPRDRNVPASTLLLTGKAGSGGTGYALLDLTGKSPVARPVNIPGGRSEIMDFDGARNAVFTLDPTLKGTLLTERDLKSGASRELLAVNGHYDQVAWGKTMLIDYQGEDGQPLHASIILPPDYVPGKKYPALVWVYAGSTVRTLDDFFLDPYMTGFYNLQLYAAQGYVIVIPSMPLRKGVKNDDYMELPKGTMPAVSRAVDLGLVDPKRLALMGHSYGGYSVYSLVTYTDRFKAAIAMAGITDTPSDYGQFDPTARGYPGIEHEKSDNWGLAENGQQGMGVPPYEDMWHYWRNSPLNYVDRVKTPLLMIHGEQDIRGPMTQAEQFFFGLYRQGKDARLLRYWGEDHGLRLSPANARNIYGEISGWLAKYVGNGSGQAAPGK